MLSQDEMNKNVNLYSERRNAHTLTCEICQGFCLTQMKEEGTLFPRVFTDNYWNKHEAHLKEHGFIWYSSVLSRFRGIIEMEDSKDGN